MLGTRPTFNSDSRLRCQVCTDSALIADQLAFARGSVNMGSGGDGTGPINNLDRASRVHSGSSHARPDIRGTLGRSVLGSSQLGWCSHTINVVEFHAYGGC